MLFKLCSRALFAAVTTVVSVSLGHTQPPIRSAIPDPSLYEYFQTFIRFSYAAGCNETIFEETYPLGSTWDKQHPTALIATAYSPNTTGAGYLAVNHYLKSIIVSFRGTSTQQLWYEGKHLLSLIIDLGFRDQVVTFNFIPQTSCRFQILGTTGCYSACAS